MGWKVFGDIGNFWDKMLGGGKDEESNAVSQEPLLTPSQQILQDIFKKYMPNYKPGTAYTGNITTKATGLENQGLGVLQNYLNNPATGQLFGAGKTQLLDTLGGKYADPATSPYIKSMMNLSKLNLRDTLDQINKQRGAGGNYFHTQTGQQLTDAGVKSQATLDTIIGDFINQERGRQLGAVPQAMAADEYETTGAPIAQVAASQKYGSLQRILDEQNMENAYQEFQRQQNQLSSMAGMGNANAQWGIKDWEMDQGDTFDKILAIIGKFLG